VINRFLHWLTHITGSNEGRVATWQEGDKIMVGFECTGCGKIDPKSVHSIFIKKESEIIYE